MANINREIKTEDMKIGTFVEDWLAKDKYLIPTFQRDFVWEPENIRKLWDSIYKFYPIGSILYWVTESYLDIVEKKETVKLIFKSVEINGGEIVSVRLYPPFQQMYEEVLKECNTLKNKEITAKTQTDQEVCILQPSADRCPPYRRTMVRRGLSESEGLAHHRTEQCRSTMVSLAEALVE